jgi:intraflagellar transport protein 122
VYHTTSKTVKISYALFPFQTGSEFSRFERPGGTLSPVWGLAWGRVPDDTVDMLCVADWGQTLSFYDVNGKQV